MALSEENKQTNTKTNNSFPKNDRKEKPLTKVIIRRLPPTIDKDEFLNQISPVPNYDYFYVVNGDMSLGEHAFSRAYINFINANDVFDFKEKFDNYVFLDTKGHEYTAVVEYAPFQRIPKKRNKSKVDPKCGTVESDPYYLEFIENLNKPVEPEDKPEFSYQFSTQENKQDKTTPLLEFVKNRKLERQKIREERREERKRKELERKKQRDEERKKRFDDKLNESESKESVVENKFSENKNDRYYEKTYYKQDYKYDDRRKDYKNKPPRKEYLEKREFKPKKEYYKDSNYGNYKKEESKFPKKIKKYSEKREERKLEAQKAESKKAEEQKNKSQSKELEEKSETNQNKPLENTKSETSTKAVPKENTNKCEELDNFTNENASEKEKREERDRAKERIRNKDRPSIAIYRPGMLSKRKQNEDEKEIEKK